jgi:hypothetical protein
MGRPGWRLDRWPRPLALLLVLAITTAWTPSPQARTAAGMESSSAAVAGAAVADPRPTGRDDASWAGEPGTPAPQVVPIDRSGEPQPELPAARSSDPQTRFDVPTPARSFSGRNHVWIPSLGMSYPVELFSCNRKRPPDNYMYRWGCAGSNNVYLLGHAYSVMKPLHDAYVRGRLFKGMVAIYADGKGRLHTYQVTEWRVVDPVDSEWAIASQPVPSMTLQTCLGKRSQWRLNVRLVAID